ncbi:hypothetical protein [Pseudoduganella namucuonensis]|uniref:Probable addiction module antidote protein n=1 Tax=Pseudoduganella namucuonensis TaxID=1035707 RepID=A0A1I7LVC3_9BURK|nr:hypothetical protein [Pseudoduganella namucuonensis]SFV13654.1 probable addiction module antidote protein [Pseudoduganella namucuonensis]
MAVELTEWNSSDYLLTKEDIVSYLEICFEDAGDDPEFIALAFENILHAPGMSGIARDAGLDLAAMRSLVPDERGISYRTMLAIAKLLGLKFRIEPLAA